MRRPRRRSRPPTDPPWSVTRAVSGCGRGLSEGVAGTGPSASPPLNNRWSTVVGIVLGRAEPSGGPRPAAGEGGQPAEGCGGGKGLPAWTPISVPHPGRMPNRNGTRLALQRKGAASGHDLWG